MQKGCCGTIRPDVSFIYRDLAYQRGFITMKTVHSGLAVALLATGFVATDILQVGQANAAPIFIPKTVTAQSDVIRVDHRRWRRGWYPAGAFVAGALVGGAIASSNRYYGGGYYGGGYYNSYYGDGYYPRYYRPRYYAPARVYYPPRGTAYRQGYRDGFRDGANARYYDDITCTSRLADAGKC
jgi:hypothetical protein